MKKSKLILILILLVLVALYLVLRSRDSGRNRVPLMNIQADLVDHIEIWDSVNKVELILENGIWKVTDPVIWPADTLMVKEFFREVVNGIYNNTAVSMDLSTANIYNLDDSQALHIRLKAAGKEEHLMLGNIGNAWDYFRRENDNQIFQTQSGIVQRFAPQIVNWRSPLILQYWEDELAQIKVSHTKNTYTLRRDNGRWYYKDAKHDFEVYFQNFALTKIVSILQNFISHSFLSGDDPEFRNFFKDPYCTVWITDIENKTRKLTFAKFLDERYILLVDDDYSVLYQVEFDTVFRFTRNPEIFMRQSII